MLTSLRKPTGGLGGGLSKTFNNNDIFASKRSLFQSWSQQILGTSHCGLLASADCFRENFGGRQPGSPDSTGKMCRQHLQGNEVLRNSPPQPQPPQPPSPTHTCAWDQEHWSPLGKHRESSCAAVKTRSQEQTHPLVGVR